MMASDDIIFAFAIPKWDPRTVTPFQGFAPGLIPICPMLAEPCRMPADLSELTMDAPDRLARRRAGSGNWQWSPVNVETLIRLRKPTPDRPFLVVFTADAEVARRVANWRRNLRIRPLHVSLIKRGGAISPVDLTVEYLKNHCRIALKQARELNKRLHIADSLAELDEWQPFEERASSLRLHSHNVILPNQMVLMSVGEQVADGDGRLEASPQQDYVDAISESAKAVLALHAQTEDRPIYLVSPPRPDIILFAPATYRGIGKLYDQTALPAGALRALRALDRQRGYTMEIAFEEGEQKQISSVLSMRGAELKIQSFAVGLRAASTVAATIRLPPAVNRTAGVVGQLARHLRGFDNNPPDGKTTRVFKIVQDALVDSIPAEHLAILRESRSGVKIVGNAPLEWLPVDGLPLGIRSDVSRINVTPGNIMIEQLRGIPPIYIPATEFKNYLVVSMFDEGDNLANFVGASLGVLPGAERAQITGKQATPRSVDEFVDAVNAYDGPILIIDSHGTHPDNPDVGGLIIGGQSVDIWALRDRIRLPPIVILSACDTHPFDRSHATVANGFLHCGALAVLGTVLPIRARDAAIFLVRLMLRAISFGETINGMGRAVAWTNIVSGALRMQLASDVVRGLVKRGLLPRDRAREVQLITNQDLNPLRPDWFERLSQRCREVGGFDEAQWKAAFDDILAASDVIRYVNLGNPESILISDDRVVQRALKESGVEQG